MFSGITPSIEEVINSLEDFFFTSSIICKKVKLKCQFFLQERALSLQFVSLPQMLMLA